MNPLSKPLVLGTIGELLVQLMLLQYNVQSAPPLKDSGNDLIAVRGNVFKTIQVKTTDKHGQFKIPRKRQYHILALVRLHAENDQILLDASEIYLIEREAIDRKIFSTKHLDDYRISRELVDRLFLA